MCLKELEKDGFMCQVGDQNQAIIGSDQSFIQ